MKKLILITATFFIINIYALPQCPSDTAARWHNCFGTFTYANGDKYVGEYKDGKYHGPGTYTYADGTEQTGFFLNGSFVPYLCQEMGLTRGTDAYGQCVIKLIDEVNK